MKTIKELLKEQREICANQIKDMNFTLSEIVRIAPEPENITVESQTAQKIIEIIDELIDPLSKQPYLTGHDLESKEDKWNISIQQSESYGAYKKLIELKEKLNNF